MVLGKHGGASFEISFWNTALKRLVLMGNGLTLGGAMNGMSLS